MKVLHHVDENHLAWAEPWIQLLLVLADQGVENHVICKDGGTLADRLKEAGLAVTTCTPWAQWFPPLCGTVEKVIDKFKPQVIHTRLSSAARISGWWGRRRGLPVLSTVDKYPKAKYYRNARLLAGCSASVSEHMVRLGFPRSCVTTVLNPIDVSHYVAPQGARDAMRQSLGLADGEIMVLGMGRFVAWKCWDLYIKAIAMMPSDLPYRFYLVGSGEEEAQLIKLARSLNLDDRLTIHPFVADVRPWLWAADIFVHPSKEEAFGIMMLEALAAGLPCIATDTGGARELIESGVNGLVVPINDAAALVEALRRLEAASERKTMAHHAMLRAGDFDVKLIAHRYIDLYKRLAGS